MKLQFRLFGLVGGIALAALYPSMLRGGALCGPGTHWIDTCAGGTYWFYSTSSFGLNLDTNGDFVLDTNLPFVQTNGLTGIFLGTGSPHQMGTELFYLYETGPLGSTLVAGDNNPDLLSEGPLYSPGQITEQPLPGTSLGDSFFDVFFEIKLPAWSLDLHNTTAMTVSCTGLVQAPPDSCNYYWNNTVLDLFDSLGVKRGELLPANAAHHHVEPTPEPSSMLLLAIGLTSIAAGRSFRNRKRA